MEPLDQRTLLAVNFTFNIIDPGDQFKSIRPKLQALLNAAGDEWSTHIQGNATLEYDVAFSNTVPPGQSFTTELAAGAAKSAQIIGTDTPSGLNVYQLGTMTEVLSGDDPNGEKADGGITIYAPNLSLWFFETDFNRRNAPIPVGLIDGYTVILHELAHSLGLASTRQGAGAPPAVGMYTYDQHFSSFGFNAYGLDATEKNLKGLGTEADLTLAIYGTSVPLDSGDPSHLVSFGFFDDLSTDLMGGDPIAGERKTISRLDLAMLADAGLPIDLAVDPTPEGLYNVNGSGFSDVIDLSSSNGTLLIRVNKSLTSFPPDIALGITAIVVNGLNGNDTITISGEAPAVAINGGAGADTIYGGPRGDSIYGGGSNDMIFGRGGGDVVRGGDGDDIIYGQGGSDRLFGNGGRDHLDGGLQTDRLFGGGSADTLIGGTEDDFLFGETGNDLLSGAGGKDRLDGGVGADQFFGGAGNDSVDYSKSTGPVIATIDGSPDDGVDGEQDNIVDPENIIGSSFDDVLIGNDGRNSLIGGAGNDTLDGGGFHDTLEGNNGNDSLIGSGGHDSLLGGGGNDILLGVSGLDHMIGDEGDDTFNALDDEIDTVEGGDGNDSVTGETDDVISEVETTDLVGPPLPLPGAVPLTVPRVAQSLLSDEDELV